MCTYPVLAPEPEFLLAAKRLGIPSVLHLLSWDNVPSKGVFPALADRYVVWGRPWSGTCGKRYPVEEQQVYRCGVPHFDRHVHAAAAIRRTSRDPPTCSSPCPPPATVPTRSTSSSGWRDRVSRGEYGKGVELIVRPHPQNVHGYLADLEWLPRIDALAELPGNLGVCTPK